MKSANWLRQTWAVMLLDIRVLFVRPMLPAIVVIGFTAVVLVMVSVLSIGRGLGNTYANSGMPDVAMALSDGAISESASSVNQSALQALASAPGVDQGAQGSVVSPELLTQVEIAKRSNGVTSNVIMRGVTAEAFQVHPKVHLIVGRMFKAGVHEIIVGRQAAREYRGLGLGSVVHADGVAWTVSGIFAAGGNIHESEIWTDLPGLQSASHMGDVYSSVYLKLTSPQAFADFAKAVKKIPGLALQVQSEKSYYAALGAGYSGLLTTAGVALAILMALGAVIGAVNLMYTSLASRLWEMATLRAVGFRRLPVLAAVLGESLIFGLVGGVIGGLIAYGAFNGYQAGTIANGITQVDFQFTVNADLLIAGIVFALIMGFIGGLFPAIRAARMPVAKALREA